ncbi:class I SAM-dependent methyltransferase [Acuticoccus sp.]|uniref:class I SAM-dependent methyltransferase n=1 Tax=Acuticoccus sp. TaxID=1904378 RepID=UPI003B52FAAA
MHDAITSAQPAARADLAIERATDAAPLTGGRAPRILVAIANYGTGNLAHVQRLIDTYRAFTMPVTIVVLSNVPKDFGPDVEVRVGLPSANPWSLPFSHRPLFVERQDDYDLFIYSEDDTEVLEAHVRTFLDATAVLPPHLVAGFLRYEVAPDGRAFYSTMHAAYHWDPTSITKVGDAVYAHYTNDHAACYMLTRDQLRRCIQSGGYTTTPHEGRYDMLVSAATDPYTRCGLRKVIGICDIDAFCLHHLADKYLGRIGIEREEVDAQVARLLQLAVGADVTPGWIEPRTTFDTIRFDKNYSEPVREELLALAPAPPSSILSVGCERGLNEARLVAAGHAVSAIPLDPVIATAAERRGVRMLPADLDAALREAAASDGYHAVLVNNVLSYLADPVGLLYRLRPLVRQEGSIIVSFDNAGSVGFVRRFLRVAKRGDLGRVRRGYDATRYHFVSPSRARRWLRNAGFTPDEARLGVPAHHRRLVRFSAGLAEPWLAQGVAIRGKPAGG